MARSLRFLTLATSLAIAGPAAAQFAGPAILTRAGVPGGVGRSSQIGLRPYINVNGIYDTGLTGAGVDQAGNLPDDSAEGVEASIGAYAYHRWKQTVAGLDYRGNYRMYSKHHYYDGIDQLLTFGVSHQLQRRLSLALRQSAGTFSRNFGYYFNPVDTTANTFVPANDLFDNRTTYLATQGDLTYQKSARLSFNFGGDFFLQRRHASALTGVTGSGAHGDVSYRLTRFTTVGVVYNFIHFGYTKAFGGTDIHTMGLQYVRRLGRFWELGLVAGSSRLESLTIARVEITDPVLTQLLGQTVGIRAEYRVNYIPNFQARLMREFRRGSLTATYLRGVLPGNGIYLATQTNSVGAVYSYTGIRRWHFGANMSYYHSSSVALLPGGYTGYNGGAGVTRQLSRALHLVARWDARQYINRGAQQHEFRRNAQRVTIGFAFSPGDVPLSLW